MLIQNNGKILVGALVFDSSIFNALFRLNADGSLDNTLKINPGANGTVYSMDEISDTKIIAVGDFTQFGGNRHWGVAKVILSGGTTFDFDGDGKSDVSVFRSGAWYINRSRQGFTGVNWGFATDILAPADFDGDGKTDVSVLRDGNWYWINSSNNQMNATQFGAVGDIPVPADFDGDGKADVAVFRQGIWYRLNSSNNAFIGEQFGIAAD